jgi:hypothetical protein
LSVSVATAPSRSTSRISSDIPHLLCRGRARRARPPPSRSGRRRRGRRPAGHGGADSDGENGEAIVVLTGTSPLPRKAVRLGGEPPSARAGAGAGAGAGGWGWRLGWLDLRHPDSNGKTDCHADHEGTRRRPGDAQERHRCADL